MTEENIWYVITTLFFVLLITLPLFGAVAYLTLAERKVIGWMQLRHGPLYTGWWGIGQPIADAIKLMFKEPTIPEKSNLIVYILAPVMVLVPAVVAWAVIPFDANWVLADINLGVVYLMAVSSLGVYGILMAGWASNSKYPFLGAVRSGAQMVSYEVSMGLCLLSVILLAGSMNLSEIVLAQQGMWNAVTLFPMFIVFLISILAETNRAPFDLPEAEAELVAGYNVEYGSMPFAMFFLGEYANMILMSAFASIMFLGGWLPPLDIWPLNLIPGIFWFFGKIAAVLFFFLWARATLPRFRYDQLMRLGWKVLLPFTLLWLVGQAFIMKLMQVGWV
ncbi:MAG: NADH-quinone oxidoreductase subunit NuoH [Alphaproteobacteria bacterium]|nr:NADH-quinone oxidoreductase subunit NuoH [Alphaproteobacteria bacterium]MDD9919742.1 NADH-quinone oxidoreductase subunit NuoH [Alphaproteobacteria bacterium]